MKVNLISLGCPKNLVDSEKLLGSLGSAGTEICAFPEQSDIVIINTCAFIEPAIVETEQEIERILSTAKKSLVYVYGCAVNRYRQRLEQKFPLVDEFFALEQNEQLLRTVQKQAVSTDVRLLTTHGYAYLKIADGCSNRCSYCTIPLIKGPYKSNSIHDLCKEAEDLARLGVKEIILIAQDTTAYGQDLYDKPMLVELIRNIAQISNIEWIRIMYAHPRSLNDGIINEIQTNRKVCKYIDLPIQHINDRLLKLMNRGTTKKQIQEIFTKLQQIKGISIRTTVITGFPGETDMEFKELLNFLENIDIDWLGVFSYFSESSTQAATLEQLPDSVIEKRYRRLLNLQNNIFKKTNSQKIGKIHKTLVHQKNTKYIGHTEYICPEIDSDVLIKTNDIALGEFCNVRFTGLAGYNIDAEVVQ